MRKINQRSRDRLAVTLIGSELKGAVTVRTSPVFKETKARNRDEKGDRRKSAR